MLSELQCTCPPQPAHNKHIRIIQHDCPVHGDRAMKTVNERKDVTVFLIGTNEFVTISTCEIYEFLAPEDSLVDFLNTAQPGAVFDICRYNTHFCYAVLVLPGQAACEAISLGTANYEDCCLVCPQCGEAI